jgi:hypothetical protein
MIPESGNRLSEKIMPEQKDGSSWRFDEKPSWSGAGRGCLSNGRADGMRRAVRHLVP